MNFQGIIGIIVVGITMLAALFLIIYGATNEQPALVTVGVGIIGTAFGAVIGHYFPSIIGFIKRKK